MKMILLAAVAATLSLPCAPLTAMAGPAADGFVQAPGAQQIVERRSKRCPGGESRPFVAGCGGA